MKIKIASRKPLEEELLLEAVENIIPPSMSVLIEYIKNTNMSKGAQDVYAQFIAEHGPKLDGRGHHWGPEYVADIFLKLFKERRGGGSRGMISTALRHKWAIEHFEEAWKESELERKGGATGSIRINLPKDHPHFQTVADSRTGMFMLTTGPKYEEFAKPTMDSFLKVAQNWMMKESQGMDLGGSGVREEWLSKYNIELTGDAKGKRPRMGSTNPEGEAAKQYERYKEGSGAKALLLMSQQYKSYLKSVKKWFKKNPEIAQLKVVPGFPDQTIEEHAMAVIQRKWDKGQTLWVQQRLKSSIPFNNIRGYLEDEKDNYQEIGAIFKNVHHRHQEVEDEHGWMMASDSMEETLAHIRLMKLSKSYQVCEDGWESVLSTKRISSEYVSGEQACALKIYKDGFFWFNRDAGVCSIAGEKLANCGTANFNDSVLLILKKRLPKSAHKADEFVASLEANPDNIDVKSERIKYRVMMEYNPRLRKVIQVLGYENSLPDKEFWEHIKDAWMELKRPPIDQLAWRHLKRLGRVSDEEIKEFEEFITGGKEEKKAAKEWWGSDGMYGRLKDGYYDDVMVSGQRGFQGNATGREHMRVRYRWKGTADSGSAWEPIQIELWGTTAPFPRNDKIWGGSIGRENEYLKTKFMTYLDKTSNAVLGRLEPVVDDRGADYMKPKIKIIRARLRHRKMPTEHPQLGHISVPGVEIELRALITINPSWFTEEELGGDKPQPDAAHNLITAFHEGVGPEHLASMMRKVKQWKEDEYEHSQSPEGQWRPGMPTPGSDVGPIEPEAPGFNFDDEGVDDVTWADLTQGNPDAVADHEEDWVAGHFGDDGTFTPDEDDENLRETRKIVKKILGEKKSRGVKMRIVENNPIQRTASHSFKDKTHPRTDWDDFKYVQARDPDEPEEFEHERSGVRETDHITIPSEIQQLWDPNDTYPFYGELERWYNGYRAKKGKAPARITQVWSPDGPVEYQGEDRAIVWARVESKDLQHNKPMPAGSKDPSGYGKGWDFKELEEGISRGVRLRINETFKTIDSGIEALTSAEYDALDKEGQMEYLKSIEFGKVFNSMDGPERPKVRSGFYKAGPGGERVKHKISPQEIHDIKYPKETDPMKLALHGKQVPPWLPWLQPILDKHGEASIAERGDIIKQGWKEHADMAYFNNNFVYVHGLAKPEWALDFEKVMDSEDELSVSGYPKSGVNKWHWGDLGFVLEGRIVQAFGDDASTDNRQHMGGGKGKKGQRDVKYAGKPHLMITDEESHKKYTGGRGYPALFECLIDHWKIVAVVLPDGKIPRPDNDEDWEPVVKELAKRYPLVDGKFQRIPSGISEGKDDTWHLAWSDKDVEVPNKKGLPSPRDVVQKIAQSKSSDLGTIARNMRIKIGKAKSKEEPNMEFVEEKEESIKAAGIIPYRGEGEDVEFLIGQSPQGWWDIFKGKIDEGETAQEAAKREFEEESSFSYDGPLEEDMALTNDKVKAWLVEMPDLDDTGFDISKISIISTDEKDKKLDKKNPYEGKPEVVAVGWFKKDEAESKMNRRQKPFIGMAFDKLNKKPLEESKEVTKLRIFDFDETIAFTSATTYVETPHREDLEFPDQESFDKWVGKTASHHGIKDFDPIPALEKLGYHFDFTEYAKVNNPQLNKKVVDHLKRIINKNKSEPIRAVYVMTARGPDSKEPISAYLQEQGFRLSDFADIITLAGSSKKDAIADLIKQHPNVESVAFWDDSDRNINDVMQLRDMYPEMDIQINHVIEGHPNPLEEGREHLRLVPPEYRELENIFPEWDWDYDGLTALVLADQWTDHLDQGMPPEDALKSLVHPLTGEQMYTEQNIYNMGGEIMMSVYDWVDSYKKGDLKENLLINIKRKK